MSDQNPIDLNKVRDLKKDEHEVPEIDFPTMCQTRAAGLIEMMMNQLHISDREAAMVALSNLMIVTAHAMIGNSDKLVVQKLLSDIKKTVADMPGPGQIITDPNAPKKV